MEKKQQPISELASLPNLGKVSAGWLHSIGITSVEQFMQEDPYELYERICEYSVQPVSKNLLKAMIGAQRGVSWLEVTV